MRRVFIIYKADAHRCREGEDRGRIEGGVLRPVDGHRRDGDAGGHLDDGAQGIQAAERLGLHGHADDGEGREGGDHARQVGGSARSGDDGAETLSGQAGDIVGERPGVAVRAEDALLVRDAERFERFPGRGHDVPVAGAAHDDGYLPHAKKSLERVIGSMYSPSLYTRMLPEAISSMSITLPSASYPNSNLMS